MSPVAKKDAWKRALEAMASCLTKLPLNGDLTVGPYHYSADPFSITREVDSQAAFFADFGFGLSGTRELEKFDQIKIWDRDDNVWILEEESLSYKDAEDSAFPTFQFVWNRQGELRFLRVNLTGHTFVNYYGSSDLYFVGDEAMLSQLPETLEGQTHLLGREIPWKIDFAAKAEEILRLSELEEFAALAAQLPLLNRR